MLLGGMQAVEFMPRLLDCLRGSARTPTDAAAALASVAALRRGQILEREEMQSLVAQLERCPEPFASPGGRKTFIHLSREDLAEEFRRR